MTKTKRTLLNGKQREMVLMLDKGIFYIKYFSKKDNKIIERQATLNDDCFESVHKVFGYPYKKYFDMEKDGIRCASKKWEINNVRTL
jgi:hypothetical protein